jgi:hypothetical protein
MGRFGGHYGDGDELDRPDLNKCPDCNCFFAGEKCPLCGKVCPENMRAGNRAAVKPKKHKGNSDSGKVVYLNWYYSWWFIILMMFIFPLVGIVLLITSHHDTWKKVLFGVIAAVYILFTTFGVGRFFSGFSDMFGSPVDKSLTREEYVAQCEAVTPEQICRSIDGYEDKFLCVKVRVIEKVTYLDKNYNEKDYVCYLCEDVAGEEYKLVIRDCLLENQQRFVAGDVITVYGEGAGECEVCNTSFNHTIAPCINMAYVVLE